MDGLWNGCIYRWMPIHVYNGLFLFLNNLSESSLVLWWKCLHSDTVDAFSSLSKPISSKNLLATSSKASSGHAWDMISSNMQSVQYIYMYMSTTLASVKLYYNLTQLVLYIKISNADLLSMLVITLAVSFLSGYVLYSDNDRVCINIIIFN